MESEWTWDRYERMYVERADGRKAYMGHFHRQVKPVAPATEAWENVSVLFWAKHPLVAVGAICQSGHDPETFHGQTIN